MIKISNYFYSFIFLFSLILTFNPQYVKAQPSSSNYEEPYRPMLTAPKVKKKAPNIIKIIKPPAKPVHLLSNKKPVAPKIIDENLEDKILEPNSSDMAKQLIRTAPLNDSEKKIMAGVNEEAGKNLPSPAPKVSVSPKTSKSYKKIEKPGSLAKELKDKAISPTRSKETKIIYPEKLKKPLSGINNYDLETVSIPFIEETTDFNPELASDIKNRIIPILNNNMSWRIQIQAFSSESLDQNINPRRLSLSRALKVREFLMDNGIKPIRIDVRALGTKTNTLPLDRVDLLLINPQNG